MKIKTKLLALVMAILIVVSCLPLVANAATASYSKVSNSGTRNEVCTSLSAGAISYYTGNYEYEDFILLSSSALEDALHDLMTSTHSNITSYNDCRDYVWQTDCERNNTSRATTLYTSHQMQSSEWSGTWSCNREHVWPQSKGGGNTSGGGADLHHIRPAEASVNSSRGNKPFGTKSGMYTPADNVKGDVARIILYVYVRWGSAWGADSVTEVFESVDVLLAWCALDPVDTWEMGRNEVVQNIQGNRNVFIDYPELAWQMFGKAAPANMTTPSGAASNGNVPSTPPAGTTPDTPVVPDNPDGNTGDSTGGGSTTPSTGALACFTFGANGDASHNDGKDAKEGDLFTSGSYTLTLTGVNKVYSGAFDAKGNSCLKIGTGKAIGGFSFTVGSDVKKVVIYIAQYKEKATIVNINSTNYTISTASNNGEYTKITVDTSSTKTVTLETVTGKTRCMIDSIEFFGSSSGGSTGENTGGNTGGGTIIPDTPSTPNLPSNIPDSFVIKNKNKYVTSTVYAYTSKNGNTKDELEMTESKAGGAVFNLVKNSDGTVSFKAGSKFLFADGTHVRLVDSASDNTKFIIEETSGGYFIKCATANYNGKAQYLEVYSGYLTCYGMGSDTAIYTFELEAVTNVDTPDTDIPEDNTPDDDKPDDNNPDDTPDDDITDGNTPDNDAPSGNTPDDDNTGDNNIGDDNIDKDNADNVPDDTTEEESGGHTELDSIPENTQIEEETSSITVWILLSISGALVVAVCAFVIIRKKKAK